MQEPTGNYQQLSMVQFLNLRLRSLPRLGEVVNLVRQVLRGLLCITLYNLNKRTLLSAYARFLPLLE